MDGCYHICGSIIIEMVPDDVLRTAIAVEAHQRRASSASVIQCNIM